MVRDRERGHREAAPQTGVVISAAHPGEAGPGTEPLLTPRTIKKKKPPSLNSVKVCVCLLSGSRKHQSRARSGQRRPVGGGARRLPGFSQKPASKLIRSNLPECTAAVMIPSSELMQQIQIFLEPS